MFTIRRHVYSLISYCQGFINHCQKQPEKIRSADVLYIFSFMEKRCFSSKKRGRNPTERKEEGEGDSLIQRKKLELFLPIRKHVLLLSQDLGHVLLHIQCVH